MSAVHEHSTQRRPIDSASAWFAADLAIDDDWSVVLDDAERDEIVTAARTALARGETTTSLTVDGFPLPRLQARVSEWSARLHAGRGFLLLRRFPIDALDPREIELGYVGLGLHLGTPVGQNASGDTLTHIRDERLAEAGPNVRLYRTNQRQDFHTDGADLVGLLCLHPALRGGESRLASAAAVYNEVLRRRPDLLEVLYRPMCWDRNGEERPGELPYFQLAPFFDLDGVPRIFYIGWYIRDAQRHEGVPQLTDDQRAAMELLESIANDPAVHVEMTFEPGDIQLLNNGRILHAREAYDDADDPDERRHLLRLWLAAHRFTSVEDGLRAGINTVR